MHRPAGSGLLPRGRNLLRRRVAACCVSLLLVVLVPLLLVLVVLIPLLLVLLVLLLLRRGLAIRRGDGRLLRGGGLSSVGRWRGGGGRGRLWVGPVGSGDLWRRGVSLWLAVGLLVLPVALLSV